MPEPEKGTISFNATRNGDRLGHDHLDSAVIQVGGYKIDINEDSICITYPYYMMSHPIYSHIRGFEADETLVVSSLGQLMKIIRIPSLKKESA